MLRRGGQPKFQFALAILEVADMGKADFHLLFDKPVTQGIAKGGRVQSKGAASGPFHGHQDPPWPQMLGITEGVVADNKDILHSVSGLTDPRL